VEVGAPATSSWKYLFSAAILGAGLLVKAGAPLVPLPLGLAVAAVFTWKKSRPTKSHPG
jgi:hypothetical protein